MGRRKIQMMKIEDKASRQVTFSKRRGGLMKKARELSILCDVEVALITISANARVYDLCSGNCLKKVLERYKIHVDAKEDVSRADEEANKHRAEFIGLFTSADLLQLVQRQFEEKNINQLNIVELMQLEQQVDVTLGQTRFRKTQLMMETLTALHEKEKQLREEQEYMEKEIAEKFSEDSHHLHEQDLVKELELNNHGDGTARPLDQVMFRLL